MYSARNKSIDTLRGFAVLLVILAHLNYLLISEIGFLYYGRFGVQIFFILTGYIFLQRDSLTNSKLFFKKRIVRLFPLYWIFILIFFLIESSVQGLLWEVLLLHSFNFSNPYGLVPGGWTISIEWLFSIILPLLYKFGNNAVNILLILFLINSWLIRDLDPNGNDWFYMNPLNQLWIFVIPLIISNKRTLILFLAALLASYLLNSSGRHLYLFAIGSMILSFGIDIFVKFGYNQNIIALIGRHSYGIYLVHFLLLEAALLAVNTCSRLIVIFLWILFSIYLGILADKWSQRVFKI